jgi:hypothetical protein
LGEIKDYSGDIVELGLGSGRTYDHLRAKAPDRQIHAFDFEIAVHKVIEVDTDHVYLGSIMETFPKFCETQDRKFPLVHLDIGTKNLDRDQALYHKLNPFVLKLINKNSIVVSDRPLELTENWHQNKDLTQGAQWKYYIYKHH